MVDGANREWLGVVLSTLLVVGCGKGNGGGPAGPAAADGGDGGSWATGGVAQSGGDGGSWATGGAAQSGGEGGSLATGGAADTGGEGGEPVTAGGGPGIGGEGGRPATGGAAGTGGEGGDLVTGGAAADGGEGADPAGGDSGAGGADSASCQENEHVVDHDCVACAAGSTRTAGDDATGPDTACTPTLCEQDHHVVYHACRACSAGTNNEAGDDASGADTACDDDPCQLAFGVTCGEFAQGYLKASNTGAHDVFGFSVSVSGDTLAVGAHYESSAATGVNGNENDDSAPDSGAVYVFVRSGGEWTQQAYLKASNTGAEDNFGRSVSLSGDTLAIGADGEDSSATGVDGD